VLHVIEATGATTEDADAARSIPASIPRLTVLNKVDVAGLAAAKDGDTIRLSAKNGEGLDLLRAELLRRGGLEGAGEDLVIARERHIEALEHTQTALDAALSQIRSPGPALELVAEELRRAQQWLNAITGEFVADDLLGEIFGRFCIGK